MLVEGSLAGRKGTYDCPIALRLYGTREPIERASLKSRMQGDRLPVDALNQREKEEKKRRMEELKKFQAAKKAMSSKSGSGRQRVVGSSQSGSSQSGSTQSGSSQSGFVGGMSQTNSIPVQNMEQIIQGSQRFNPREMGEVVEKYGAGEDILSQMPMAEFPERLATKLLPYQRQALAWLIDKENPRLPAIGSQDVVQLWKRSAWDGRMFTNIATNFSLKDQEPSLASGGILAVSRNLARHVGASNAYHRHLLGRHGAWKNARNDCSDGCRQKSSWLVQQNNFDCITFGSNEQLEWTGMIGLSCSLTRPSA